MFSVSFILHLQILKLRRQFIINYFAPLKQDLTGQVLFCTDISLRISEFYSLVYSLVQVAKLTLTEC